jgi:hypothetical protein
MKTGFFGIGIPKLDVITELLFGLRRGILWLARWSSAFAGGNIGCGARRSRR